jgi:adenylate cyclase
MKDVPDDAAATCEPLMESGRELAQRLRRRWALHEIVAMVVGAFVVFTFLHAFHSAADPSHPAHAAVSGSLQLLGYLAIALPLGWVWRERRSAAIWRWLSEDRAAEPAERDFVLREPLRELVVPAALWGAAAILFGALELPDLSHALETVVTIALGGVTTCALVYLLVERLLRPATARSLAHAPPERPVGPGVPARLITAWALASGVPLLGLGFLAIGALGQDFRDAASLAVAVLVLTGAGLAAGAIATVLSARSLADPIGAVRGALARVHAGDLDVQVAVDDGSEVGLLQAGFNEMAAGLRERERLRDLFGRHVGEEVARRALASGVALGGEVRQVAALFVDLVGSTTLAARAPAGEIVALLNRFFGIVVEVVEAHGGWVNKFEGDAALCVFGAPTDQPDAADRALAAGRVLSERLRYELPELEAGVGISAGPAVAGNVGAERRLEYTVIGDPVNEAARLCELAKSEPARVLASGATLAHASSDEAARWRLGEEVVLRGRAAPTRLATPAADRENPKPPNSNRIGPPAAVARSGA